MESPTNETNSGLVQIDILDPTYATLSRAASRIATLLKPPIAKSNAELPASLDDFLGAVYALISAKKDGFKNRPDRSISIPAVEKLARQIASGKLRTDGKWIAGFHFNSALFRTAAVSIEFCRSSSDATTICPRFATKRRSSTQNGPVATSARSVAKLTS